MRTPIVHVIRALGLGRPAAPGMVTAASVSAVVVAFYPAFSRLVTPLPLLPDWPWRLVGLLAYHGVAEELAWRGYAFRRMREGRSFGAAVLWTMPLIAATHLPILVTAGPVVGAAAIVVAAATCVPLAYLWERGGRTIWAPALVHAAIDVFKLVEVPTGPAATTFSLGLAAVSALVPFLAFADRMFRTPAKLNCGPNSKGKNVCR
jgi:membrane protease YdiL (CAAX protease family)